MSADECMFMCLSKKEVEFIIFNKKSKTSPRRYKLIKPIHNRSRNGRVGPSWASCPLAFALRFERIFTYPILSRGNLASGKPGLYITSEIGTRNPN